MNDDKLNKIDKQMMDDGGYIQMSIKRISISFALSVILALWIPLKCMATVSDAVNYSSDFFNSDYGRALVIQNALNNMGRSVSISSRPTVAYGVWICVNNPNVYNQ